MEKKKMAMKMEDILNVIKMLACSQGFYGRLYRAIMELAEEDEEQYEEFCAELEAQEFTDSVDVVLYFEQ